MSSLQMRFWSSIKTCKMGFSLNFRKTHFITSAPDLSFLPQDQGIEIAFAGRSNAGKSSAINAICDQSNLTKTSKTPGRTRMINLFEVEPGYYLVDLPGYGYAQVPESVKKQWQKSMTDYLQKRMSLRAIVIAMDIRHPLKDHDRLILSWSMVSNLSALILLTKADKLSASARTNAVQQLKLMLSEFGENFTIIPFSAWKNFGVQECRDVLNSWFNQFHQAQGS